MKEYLIKAYVGQNVASTHFHITASSVESALAQVYIECQPEQAQVVYLHDKSYAL